MSAVWVAPQFAFAIITYGRQTPAWTKSAVPPQTPEWRGFKGTISPFLTTAQRRTFRLATMEFDTWAVTALIHLLAHDCPVAAVSHEMWLPDLLQALGL